MCGIAGVATTDGAAPDIGLLRAMTDTIAHRGPDGEGHVSMPGCGLGHRRLSIIDLSGGAQPMADEQERCWVTFNGEIYNFLELRPGLEARGHRFHSRSDTEVLVHLLEEKWTAAVPDLEVQELLLRLGVPEASARQIATLAGGNVGAALEDADLAVVG